MVFMVPGVVEQRVVQFEAPGVVVPRVGSPVRRRPAYKQVEGPPLLEPAEIGPTTNSFKPRCSFFTSNLKKR